MTRVAEAREADAQRAVLSAKAAFEDGRWSKVAPRDRARILTKAAGMLKERLPELARIETLTSGRCLREYNAQVTTQC